MLLDTFAMARIVNGLKQPTSLFEAAAWHRSIAATCPACGHQAIFDPHQLWWLFQRKRWHDGFGSLETRLRCTRCGRRGARIDIQDRARATINLPWPDEREWKRALSRWRG
ncbi:hypothetical protein ACPVPU_01775 [Sphingomonas sp. CJ99]